jgi:hypothetical protein
MKGLVFFKPTTQPTKPDVLYDFRELWQFPRSRFLVVGFGSKSAEAAAMIIHLSINSSYIASSIRPTLCGNLLHVLIGRGIDLCVPQVSLDVLRRSLALRQRCHRSA